MGSNDVYENTRLVYFQTLTIQQWNFKSVWTWHSLNVFRNITIVDPKFSYGQGVIIGSEVDSFSLHLKTKLFESDFFDNIFQDLPMKNIVFDGVRVLQADNSNLERYHTCKGDMKLNLEKDAKYGICLSGNGGSWSCPFHTRHTPLDLLTKI